MKGPGDKATKKTLTRVDIMLLHNKTSTAGGMGGFLNPNRKKKPAPVVKTNWTREEIEAAKKKVGGTDQLGNVQMAGDKTRVVTRKSYLKH